MKKQELYVLLEKELKKRSNVGINEKFNLLDYYSFTSLKPEELAVVARTDKKPSLALNLITFGETFSWLSREINMNDRLKNFYSIYGHEFTPDEKLTIYEKIREEGYPLIDGVYDVAARMYVMEGIDAISKEKIREKVVARNTDAKTASSQNKKLVK